LTNPNHASVHPTIFQSIVVQDVIGDRTSNRGIAIAVCIITLWATSLVCLLSINLLKCPIWLIPLAVLWQMFLYTGLFITAHDAMHGSVFPQNPKVNALVGRLTVFLYGFFSYRKLLQKHFLHHKYPATEFDPDFHDGVNRHPIMWYLHFMRGYWDWRQWLGMLLIYNLFMFELHIPEINLILFWAIPSLLSSVQLFYFGTFLTHREPESGYSYPHCAQTTPLPTLWSFITCYHFGYHEEHHEYPHVSWWQLPAIHKQREFALSCNQSAGRNRMNEKVLCMATQTEPPSS
jgi:beta-carotene/zeaxanthin 4-ketolase